MNSTEFFCVPIVKFTVSIDADYSAQRAIGFYLLVRFSFLFSSLVFLPVTGWL